MQDVGKDAIDVSATITAKVGEKALETGAQGVKGLLRSILQFLKFLLQKALEKVEQHSDQLIHNPGKKSVKELMGSGEAVTHMRIPNKDLKKLKKQSKELNFQYALVKSGKEWIMIFKSKDVNVVSTAFQNIRNNVLTRNGQGGKVKLSELERDGDKARHIEIDKADLKAFRKAAKESGLVYAEQKVTGTNRTLIYYCDSEKLESVLTKMAKPNVGEHTNSAFEELKQQNQEATVDLKDEQEPTMKESNVVDLDQARQQMKANEDPTAGIHIDKAEDGTYLYIRGSEVVVSKNETQEVVCQKFKDTFGLDDTGAWTLWNKGLDRSRNEEVANLEWNERKGKRPSIQDNIRSAEKQQSEDIARASATKNAQVQSQPTHKAAPSKSNVGIAR